jgi:hypothetical protein
MQRSGGNSQSDFLQQFLGHSGLRTIGKALDRSMGRLNTQEF